MVVGLGLLILATAFFSHSLSMVGAEGWTLLDLALPPMACLCLWLCVVHRTLTPRLRQMSLLPAAMLFLVILHVFTDPRLDEILYQLTATRLPTGGFRLYYSIAVNVLLYYVAPLVISDAAKLRRFQRIYLGFIIFQVVFTCLRIPLKIDKVPWDSYGSQIMAYDANSYWGEGLRLIVLGDMGMHLFIFALVFMSAGTRWRTVMMIAGMGSILYSKGRAPMLAALLVWVLYLVLERRRWMPAFLLMGGVGCVLGFFAVNTELLEGLPATPKRFLSILAPDNPEYQSDTYSRREMWDVQWYVIRRNPIWGSMNDFPVTADEDAKSSVRRGDTHGVYLGMAALFGVPVLLLWVVLVLRQVLRAYDLWRLNASNSEARRWGMWLFMLLVAYLFKYGTSGNAGGGYTDFFLLWALVDIAHKVVQREAAPARTPLRALPTLAASRSRSGAPTP